MATQLSPGVYTREIDLTNSVPAVGTSGGAFVGNFAWGPVEQLTQISNGTELLSTFSKPNDSNYVDWYSASNFLSYTGDLRVVRVIDSVAKNASNTGTGVVVKNAAHFEATRSTLSAARFVARYPGALGNSIKVEIVDSATWAAWSADYKDLFDSAPGTSDAAAAVGASDDEVHVLVIDHLGLITGTSGTVLERYSFLSKASDSKDLNNQPNYYLSVINRSSSYVWAPAPLSGADLSTEVGDPTGAWGSTLAPNGVPTEFALIAVGGTDFALSGGVNTASLASGDVIRGLDLMENAEEVDVSLIFLGDCSGASNYAAVAQHAIDNIAETRKDCLVFISPRLASVLNQTSNDAVSAILADHTLIGRTSSYAVMDSGWKLQYDVHNDKYRWIPLNADIAGICARVDNTNDPWWSPAGHTRGVVKNVASLAFNPNKTSRDALYKVGVNSVVNFTDSGVILYGDKTLQGKNSAFSYIGTRRLFIALRKSISRAARAALFEFNDAYTRAAFLNLVNPYLREVKGRRGMDDFKVVCDTTNNTPAVIKAGEFVGDIYIKPQYSIQFVSLNFIAVGRDVEFTEVAGATV